MTTMMMWRLSLSKVGQHGKSPTVHLKRLGDDRSGLIFQQLKNGQRSAVGQQCIFSTRGEANSVVGLAPENDDKNKTKETKSASKTGAYMELAKAKLSSLVVATTAAGFIAAGGPISTQLDVLGSAVVGTALCSSCAAGWNQIFEQNRDSKMKRTQQRPLVKGTLTTNEAITATTLWGVAGTSILALGTDPVTTTLGASNIVLYAGAYTYMKRFTIYNTWVGAIVGAVPPVMGWTAATGGSFMDIEAMLLGSLLYLWQMPHFFALSYMHRVDYARGGFAMVPCLEEDGEKTASLIVRYAWYLSAVPFVATATQVTSSMFALEGIALNAYALSVAHKFQRERTNANARKVFLTSLWYLPSLLMLFLIHSKNWDEEKDEEDAIASFLSNQMKMIRNKGRELCVHEAVVPRISKGSDACPVTVASRQSRSVVKKASASVHETADTVANKNPSPSD
mmetsp:Transcript_15254/g.42234  ORF Transcript_15254/g.42234 Transcript_15254/m.42234 type:complete len:452 (+) Transcript_15254:171-1526(+)